MNMDNHFFYASKSLPRGRHSQCGFATGERSSNDSAKRLSDSPGNEKLGKMARTLIVELKLSQNS